MEVDASVCVCAFRDHDWIPSLLLGTCIRDTIIFMDSDLANEMAHTGSTL